jgi:predicted DNA-binding transcriptional regulator AlpA
MTADNEKRFRLVTDRLLTGKDAAPILGTTWKTLKTWRCQGKGPKFVKIGASVRYRTSDLEAYIKGLQSE